MATDHTLEFDDYGARLTIPEGPNGEPGEVVRYALKAGMEPDVWRAWVEKDARRRVREHTRSR
jgi:hypothetical protein